MRIGAKKAVAKCQRSECGCAIRPFTGRSEHGTATARTEFRTNPLLMNKQGQAAFEVNWLHIIYAIAFIAFVLIMLYIWQNVVSPLLYKP